MTSFSGRVLANKQIHEHLHDDSDSFSEYSQDSDIDIFDHIEPDAKICGLDLSDSCSNYDDGHASPIGGGGSGSSGGATKTMIKNIGLSGTTITMIST
jgi:hypothetical protein